MATSGISAPAEGRVKIRDSYLEAHYKDGSGTADIDIYRLTPAEAFEFVQVPRTGGAGMMEPRGISVNGAIDSDENTDLTATSGIVYGRYKNDPDNQNPLDERFSCGITHPCRFKMIRPRNTTARGIIIKF